MDFNYPLDIQFLLRQKKHIKKELCGRKMLLKKRIAILGGSTTVEFRDQLELFILQYGIETEFYQSEYGQYYTDAVFGNEKLEKFEPDIIYIFTTWRNIESFPNVKQSKLEVEQQIERVFCAFEEMWNKLSEKYKCPIIQNNFDKPNTYILGNRDIWDYRGKSNYLFELNRRMYTYAQEHNNFFINDIERLQSEFGLSKWNNAFYWNNYRYAMDLKAIPSIAESASFIIKSIYGFNKKVIALDLDNTLWGGVIGDEGIDGIALGPETPRGQVYYQFQNYLAKLKEIGVILSINSKNDYENALLGLRHPNSILKEDDFVIIEANWDPKNINIERIAAEINVGVDSIVFIDDNPAEREIVRVNTNAEVLNFDSIEDIIDVLNHQGYFEVTSFSTEDTNKTALYQQRRKAKAEMSAFVNYSDYLKSLKMKAVIKPFESVYYERISQLSNKSNQFNLTTLRCTENEIKKIAENASMFSFYGRLEDKFGDNGLVSVCFGKVEKDKIEIDLWLMSCRVLKRGLEDAMMNELVRFSKKNGKNRIIGYFIPTEKNAMVKNFYAQYGFRQTGKNGIGATVWELNVNEYQNKEIYMEVSYE